MRGLILCLVALLTGAEFARANSSITVHSRISSQDVFEVVYLSDKDSTVQEPGIYALVRGKDSIPVIKGNVLDVSRGFNGVLTQFSIASTTRAYESLAVVDGRLVIFNQKSVEKDPKSIIAFGENTPLIDAITGTKVTLGPILSTNEHNLNVQTLESYQAAGELFLISIKQPNIHGNGITFAAILDRNATTPRLVGEALVVDYSFLSATELRKLARGDFDILSRNHLLSSAQGNPNDDRILKKYRENLGRLANELRGREGAKKGTSSEATQKSILVQADPETGRIFSPPVFDIRTRQLKVAELPVQKIADTPFRIYLRVDPFLGQSGIFVGQLYSGMYSGQTAAQIPGRVDYDPTGHRYKIVDLGRSSNKNFETKTDEAAALISINGRSQLIFPAIYEQHRVVDIDQVLKTSTWMSAKRISGLRKIAHIDGVMTNMIFVSMDLPGKAVTYVFRVNENESHAKLVDTIKLQSRFSDLADLRSRIKEISLNGEIQLLFDNVNERFPREVTTESEALIRSVPYLDLRKSSSAQLVQMYEKPMRIEGIYSDTLDWRYFNPKGSIRNQSGFYLKTPRLIREAGVNIPEFQLMQGMLLNAKEKDGDKNAKKAKGSKKDTGILPEDFSPIIMDHTIDLEERDIPQLKMVMVPYLTPEQEKGSQVGFQLAIAIQEIDGSALKIAPRLTNIHIPIAFSRFQGLKVIQGRRKAARDLSLLIFVGEKAGSVAGSSPGRGGAGVLSMPLTATLKADSPLYKIFLDLSGDMAWVHTGELSPMSVKNRVNFDATGNVLWVTNPELEKTDRNYHLGYLNYFTTKKHIYPNQGLNSVAIRYDETLSEDFELTFRKDSRWLVDFKSQLETRFPAFSKYMDEVQKKKEIEENNSKKRRGPTKPEEVLFPDLNDYLNQIASTSQKNEHTVMLVDPELYQTVRNLMMRRLATNEEGNDFRLSSDKFRFYAYDPSFMPKETLENLQRIGRNPSKKELLYLDMESVLNTELSNPPRSFSKKVEVEDGYPNDESTDNSEESTDEDEKAEKDKDNDTEDSKKESALTEDTVTAGDDRQKEMIFDYSRLASIALEGEPVNLRRFSGPAGAHRFSSLALATPAQWRQLTESFPEELRNGVFGRFKMDARFLTASWTVWGPRSSKATKEVVEYNRNPFSRDEYQVFQNLERLLMNIGSEDGPIQHQLLVVPEEIKPLITKLIMTRWATDVKDLSGTWNYKNRNLALFQVNSPSTTQENILDNYESMRGSLVNRRPVLLADMADLLKIGRPQGSDHSFRLRDPVTIGKKSMGILNASSILSEESAPPAELDEQNAGAVVDSVEEEETLSRSQLPHVLWWIAAEGRKIQPKKSRGWQLNQEVSPQIPTIIVTTEKEIETLEQDTAFEQRFLDLKQMFQVVQLDKPSEEDKRRLVEDLFHRPEIASLQYSFSHEDLSSEEARRQLIGLLIGKVEQISNQLGIESTHAFLKIYVTLKRALTEDSELRRQRDIDASYLFRLFSRVFPLPLSYSILRSDDPWQKLRDPDRAARSLQELGYEGSIEFKSRIVRAVTSHTRGGMEAGRKIPSSLVVIGEPGTGKSFIFETIIKLLNLKLYDYNKPLDEEAGAMIIRVQDIVDEDDPAHPEKMSVAKVIRHINNFLSMPNGWRGMVLFDDLHKAGSTKVLKELMTFIQTLFEAQNGLIKVRRMNPEGGMSAEVREIPVRNLQLGITLNPTKDKKKRERFIDRWETKNPVMEAVAALTRDDYQLEDSVFSRVGDVIDMSEFPREAKIPSLLNKMREANHQEFSSNPRVVAVTPRTLDALVSAFPHSNARDFLTPATYSLLSLPNSLVKAPIYIIDPTENMLASGEKWLPDDTSSGGSQGLKVEPGQIEDALRRSTVVHAVQMNDPRSKLHLLSFILDNFRGLVYNSVVLGTQASPHLNASHETRVTLMTSFLAAFIGNLGQHPRLPIANVAIKPQELGVKTYDGIYDLQAAVATHSSNAHRQVITIPSYQNTEERVDLNSFLGIEAPNPPERQRMDVLIETSQHLQKILEPLLAKTMHTSTLANLTDPNQWINQLSDESPKEAFKQSSQAILEEYLKFSRKLYELGLSEMRNPDGVAQMQIYDEVRLFALCLDSALTQLPWSYVTEFLLRSLNLATSDLAVGQKTNLQHFLFKSPFSPLATITPESIIASANSMGVMKNVSSERMVKWVEYFDQNCESFLASPNKGADQ